MDRTPVPDTLCILANGVIQFFITNGASPNGVYMGRAIINKHQIESTWIKIAITALLIILLYIICATNHVNQYRTDMKKKQPSRQEIQESSLAAASAPPYLLKATLWLCRCQCCRFFSSCGSKTCPDEHHTTKPDSRFGFVWKYVVYP